LLLVAAVERDAFSEVEYLLEHGADPNQSQLEIGPYGVLLSMDSPLHTALEKGLPSMVEILLAKGADPQQSEATMLFVPFGSVIETALQQVQDPKASRMQKEAAEMIIAKHEANS
jgi:ankyrin repeat protein